MDVAKKIWGPLDFALMAATADHPAAESWINLKEALNDRPTPATYVLDATNGITDVL